MKALLLVRHASAGNDPPGGGDRERKLDEGGIYEARQAAELLKALPRKPTAVLCSSADRTVETLEILRPALGAGVAIEVEDDLYLAGWERLLRAVAEADDSHQSVLVVAHNPGIAELAQLLVNDGDPDLRAQLSRGFPPASLVHLQLDVEFWAEVRPHAARLIDFSKPRGLH